MASALSKAFTVMWLLRRSPGSLTLTEIARGAKIAPSTAHAALSELSAQGAVIQEDGRRYRLGPAMFYLGAAYVRSVQFYGRVWPGLVQLADDLGLTAVVLVLWGDHHLIVDVHRNAQPGVEVAFGGRVPLDAGAWGKAYYASLGEAPESLTPYTAKTTTDRGEYQRQLDEAVVRGYTTDREEFLLGAGAVASAITTEHGLEGIISLVGAVGGMTDSDFQDAGQRLAGLSASVSYALGDYERMKVLGRD